jgi:hypothetical protein
MELYDLGLAVLPAPKDDGKSIEGVVRGISAWRRRLPRWETEKLFDIHGGSCIALLVGFCRTPLVVVDCDDDYALAVAEARFGRTLILVRTPRGVGGHLYYRAPAGEVRQQNLRRSEGLAIDIKAGKGAVVIAPPSIRPSTGIPYRFERGSWADLSQLPLFPLPGSNVLDRPSQVREGSRNNHLFRRGLHLALGCSGEGELLNKLLVVNEAECEPPLDWNEVLKIARSAWDYESSGRNWVGREARVHATKAELDRLSPHSDALALFLNLRHAHRGRREAFCASPKAMAQAEVVNGWRHPHRYRKAIQLLLDLGFLVRIRTGGRGARDPSLYALADRSLPLGKGAFRAPNINHTPSPLPSCPMLAEAPSVQRTAA